MNSERKKINKIEAKKNEINVIKEEEIESKENNIISSNSIINSKDKTKENKTNLQNKNLDIEKLKNFGKTNFNENNNQRINNFINYTNSNLRNRYYSSNTSNHIFRNFIRKTNYNQANNNISNYYENNLPFNDNRTSSFTSRINNNIYVNKGLNYLLGNNNPNNLNQKDIIDYRKRQGYDYKKNKKGKRNNYMNKKLFFNLNEEQNKQDIHDNNFNLNNNYPQNPQVLNKFKNINELYIDNRNNMTSSKQKFLHMNDFLFLDNLEMKIMNIGNNLLNFIENNMENIFEPNYSITNNELNTFSSPLKIINPGTIDYFKNNNNISFNIMNFNMNMGGNPYFG